MRVSQSSSNSKSSNRSSCATLRTSGLRNRGFKTAGAAASSWFDTVMPVGIRYESEIGVRIFQGMNKGAVLGNSVSDGFQFQISVSTLCSSASVLGDAAIGYAHTHPGTDLFSSADLKAGRDMYRRTNRPTMPLDIEVFVGLTDGRM